MARSARSMLRRRQAILRRRLGRWADPRFLHTGRWMALSATVGVVAGVGAVVFDQVFALCTRWLLAGIGGFAPPAPGAEQVIEPFGPLAPWRLVVCLVLGALVSGWMVFRFAPEAEGHGTDAVIGAFHTGLGKIRARVPVVKMLSSSLTIGAGGSAGREGPVAQIGAGFGSYLGDRLKLSNRERRILMLAGVAGGVGAIFRSPLGAALFAGEVLYREPEFEYESLLPGLLSAIVGYSIYASYAGWEPMFSTPAVRFEHPLELGAYALLGVTCAVAAVLYTRVFYGVRALFQRLSLPAMVTPAAGAALLGLLALYMPEVLGMGYGYVQQVIDGELHALRAMLRMLSKRPASYRPNRSRSNSASRARPAGSSSMLLKMVATSLTISSGGSGGVFAPSLAIGGVLGGAFGVVAADLAPSIVVDTPASFVLVGMGAFFAGAAKVPLAAVVMVMEMTGSYGLLAPTLLASTVAYLLVPLGTSLYENQVKNRIDSPAHLGSFAVDLLQQVTVAEALQHQRVLAVVREDLPSDQLPARLKEHDAIAYPVVDGDGNLTGLLTLEEIRRALVADMLTADTLVRDIAQMGVEPVCPSDDLRTVLKRCVGNESYVMPVVESRGSRRVIGTLRRGEVLLAYDREIRRRRSTED